MWRGRHEDAGDPDLAPDPAPSGAAGRPSLNLAASGGVSTVRDFKAGRRDPTKNNLAAIQAALEKGGVAFVENSEGRGIMAPHSTGIFESDIK